MSLLVTLYENLTNYMSDRLSARVPYPGASSNVLPVSACLYEEGVLTRIYEQMEMGLLIPYNLFPKKKRVTLGSGGDHRSRSSCNVMVDV
jgi:hypothetical protein